MGSPQSDYSASSTPWVVTCGSISRVPIPEHRAKSKLLRIETRDVSATANRHLTRPPCLAESTPRPPKRRAEARCRPVQAGIKRVACNPQAFQHANDVKTPVPADDARAVQLPAIKRNLSHSTNRLTPGRSVGLGSRGSTGPRWKSTTSRASRTCRGRGLPSGPRRFQSNRR